MPTGQRKCFVFVQWSFALSEVTKTRGRFCCLDKSLLKTRGRFCCVERIEKARFVNQADKQIDRYK